MNIREQIAREIQFTLMGKQHISTTIDEILALVDKHYNEKPSGLVGTTDCKDCGGQGWYIDGPTEDPQQVQCRACNGSGRIERDIPIAEALEWAKTLATGAALVEIESAIITRKDGGTHLGLKSVFLPSGERIEVKGGA